MKPVKIVGNCDFPLQMFIDIFDLNKKSKKSHEFCLPCLPWRRPMC